jgi:nucleoside-diphosphate-sugar epimerase
VCLHVVALGYAVHGFAGVTEAFSTWSPLSTDGASRLTAEVVALEYAAAFDLRANRFGNHPIQSDPQPRPFDIPWLVLDTAEAERVWGWKPATPVHSILEEIAAHAEQHPDWLEWSADA